MQNPPPGQPPAAAAGIDKKTGAILAYVLGWLTGVVMMFVGHDDPDVKYHGAQSTIFFGSLTILFWVIEFIYAFMPGVIKFLLTIVLFVIAIYAIVVWVMCLLRANNGGGARFEIPLVGSYVTPYAEQLANAV